MERAYLVAEIRMPTTGPCPVRKEPWIAIKRRLYLAHPPCEAVLMVEPLRGEIGVDLRVGAGWASTHLTRPDEPLNIPSCWLRCVVADIYDGTPLNRRASR